jgi:hypothetical protein
MKHETEPRNEEDYLAEIQMQIDLKQNQLKRLKKQEFSLKDYKVTNVEQLAKQREIKNTLVDLERQKEELRHTVLDLRKHVEMNEESLEGTEYT